jgi:NDP-sugar pyrophosphorylase family protein
VAQELASQGHVAAATIHGEFVDIGVPEDYRRFRDEFTACR